MIRYSQEQLWQIERYVQLQFFLLRQRNAEGCVERLASAALEICKSEAPHQGRPHQHNEPPAGSDPIIQAHLHVLLPIADATQVPLGHALIVEQVRGYVAMLTV